VGFQMRKSMRVAPGIRLNFSKSGVGVSGGVKGYTVSRGPSGRVTRTASIPGSGIRHVSSSSARSGGRRSAAPPPPAPRPAKPGLLAPKAEKSLYKAIQDQNVAEMDRIAQEGGDFAIAAAALAGVLNLSSGNDERARALLGWVFQTGRDPATHPFIQKYVSARFTLEVAAGATAELTLDRSGLGLALAELHQGAGDLDSAIAVTEQLEPTTFAALSLAELYSAAGRHQDVVELTDGIRNDDDTTALLCVFRGVAFREQGYFDAARESFKEALKSRKRERVIRHRAWLERARTYEAEGKRGMAKKDLERIMAEDSTYSGLAEALEGLEPSG
jgi:tetratricopeptide (TPR) repeat protein